MQMTKHDYALVQRALNERMGLSLKADGVFGPKSQEGLRAYQSRYGLSVTGTLDESTMGSIWPYVEQRFATIKYISDAAEDYGLDPAALLAFWEVESIGAGFLTDGRCVILFERHKFYEYVSKRLGRKQAEIWRKDYPDLCHPVWDSSIYEGGFGEWNRLGRASALDAVCALLSTSWGLFQIMGFNYAMAGYEDVQSMVAAFSESEKNHVVGACNFIASQRSLLNALRERNWNAAARIYNGPGYAKNNYHVKLADAYRRWLERV